MKKSIFYASIGRRIFIYLLIFSLIIVGSVGFATKYILPKYYLEKQLAYLKTAKENIQRAHEKGNYEEVESEMKLLQKEMGGELYYYDESNERKDTVLFNKKNRTINSKIDKSLFSEDVGVYEHTNKFGVKIHIIGVNLGGNYLLYEVDIQTLNKAVSTILQFVLILLGIVLSIAIIISYILSYNISKPIRELNKLAESMKTKKVEPVMITKYNDEIGELNQTLNELYEELRGNIFKLNAELNKEINTERLKKRFLAQATHELKTPIAVIRGYSELLYDGMYRDEDELNIYLKNIYDESEAISNLIVDVLDYTKLETGNYKLNKKLVNLSCEIPRLVERYRGFVEGKNLVFDSKQDLPDLFFKSVDIDRIAQVYKNLISNAVEHAEIRISTDMSKIGNRFKISVSNDGPQIDEGDILNIFESFYKRQGKKTGSGLGLAIVKEIISLHGGEYWVENTESGVRFVVIL